MGMVTNLTPRCPECDGGCRACGGTGERSTTLGTDGEVSISGRSYCVWEPADRAELLALLDREDDRRDVVVVALLLALAELIEQATDTRRAA